VTYPRDLINTCVLTSAHTQQTVTGTVTGPARDLIAGCGRVNCIVQTDAVNLTAATVQVEQSTAATGTYTVITGASVPVTAAGVTGFSFDRDQEFVRSFVTINGTSLAMSAVFVQQLQKVGT
jgi:hypothetical protein